MSRARSPRVARPARPQARLGPLEVAVMDRLWDLADGDRAAEDPTDVDPSDGRRAPGVEKYELGVTAVHAAVGRPRRLSRNTIQSTLERLVRKGLATRRRKGRAYVYAASGTRRDWIARAFDDLVEGLGRAPGAEVLAGFVDFAERTRPETLAMLESLVAARLRARAGTDREAQEPPTPEPAADGGERA